MNRRNFMKFLGFITGSTFLTSCGIDRGIRKIISYAIPPEKEIIPGEPVFYNTTCTECPALCGIQVKAYEKIFDTEKGIYPVKLEGIPDHPINDGTLCIRGQASITRLYNPHRIKNPMAKDRDGVFKSISWDQAFQTIISEIEKHKTDKKYNFFLSSRTTGSLSSLIDEFCHEFNMKRLPELEIYNYSAIRKANSFLFEKYSIPYYNIKDADFLLTIGADIFETFISPVSHAVQFFIARKNNNLRWFHVEPHLSLTGICADKRFIINPGTEIYLLIYILTSTQQRKTIGNISPSVGQSIPALSMDLLIEKTGLREEEIFLIRDAYLNSKKPLLITGGVSTSSSSGFEAAVLSGLIQWASGSIGSLVDFSREENYSRVGTIEEFVNLLKAIDENDIGLLFFLKTDPVSILPPHLRIKEKLLRAGLKVSLSDSFNETTKLCDLILPLSHFLESWGDANPRRGLVNLIQPATKAIFNTKSDGDIIIEILRRSGRVVSEDFKSFVLGNYQKRYGKDSLNMFIEKGYHEENPFPVRISLNEKNAQLFLRELKYPEAMKTPLLIFSPSLRFFDGRSSDLELLKEIPDPISTISYGNWVSLSEETAKRLNISERDELEISKDRWSIRVPAKIQKGIGKDIFIVQIGGSINYSGMTDPRSGEILSYIEGINIRKTGKKVSIPILSGSMSQKGRGIIPYPIHRKENNKKHKESLYPEHKHENYRWAMAIDLDLCIGCSACVAACYIENNVPIVGIDEHLKGREMSWIRLEPFYDEKDEIRFHLMLCQQCNYAPCEPVCPVYATYHNPEGINAQIYNRCVGTRYCSNNCPYKVRRFNWYPHEWEFPRDRLLNPEVSARQAGVMEKCTFCIQRIRKAHDIAKDEGRSIRDGEVIPACAQTCPTRAITFGNILDKNSSVYKLSKSDRSYRIFEQLGTEPSIYYLGKRKRDE